MTITADEIRKNYQDNLLPEDYHKEIHEELLQDSEAEIIGSLTSLYEVLKSGKFKGNKLLDLGSGPTFHNVASASAYYEHIVLSEFVEVNCVELKKWLQEKSKLDWSPFLNLVAKIEGFKDINSGEREIEARIRRNVKSVIQCDVLSDEIVSAEDNIEYDVIISSEAICAAAPDYESYKSILKRINSLLRLGGGLILIGFFNDAVWGINGNIFHTLPLNQEQIEKALDFAGFTEKEWSMFPRTPGAFYKSGSMFNVAATKTRNVNN